LKEAKDSGVNVLAYTCRVTPDSLELSDPVEVLL
jgi:DNA-binding sugar fermentation-stimulating protein